MNIKEICLNISNTIKNYIDNKVPSKLSDLDNDLISSTAKVGQTVVVKNVGENGKPTEWEPTDLPEQVQTDWNQSDETAKDYIKNRPFYSEFYTSGDPITYSFDVTDTYMYKISDEDIREKIVVGNTYGIVINYNKAIYLKAKEFAAGTVSRFGGEIYLGDKTFTIILSVGNIESEYPDIGVYFLIWDDSLKNSGSTTIQIFNSSEIVQKIDKKYLPEFKQLQTDWNQNDKTQSDYIKNRPFYSYYDYILTSRSNYSKFSDIQDLGVTMLYTDSQDIGTTIDSEGIEFEVSFDFHDYRCVSKLESYSCFFYVGNAKLLTNNDEDDTGEPFIIIGSNILAAEKDGEHRYTISKKTLINKPIPLEYIPMGSVNSENEYPVSGSDVHNAINESLDYELLRNKPFYEEVNYENLITEGVYSFTYQSSSNTYRYYKSTPSEVSKDITISVNGNVYDLVYGTNSSGYPCWGDPTFESCPIYVDSDISEVAGFLGCYIQIHNSILNGSTSSSLPIKIRLYYISDTVIHQIDPKFIPSDCHTDVQINGTSIVENGVANIPIGYMKLGLLRVSDSSSNSYIYVDRQTGFIGIGVKSNTEIINRSNVRTLLASGSEDTIVRVAMCDGKGQAWTDTEKTGAWSRLSSIKTLMDEVAVAGASYFLGELTELSVVLPDDALVGQEITASWYNGDTASTLSITGNMLNFDYTPSANTRSEISCLWDGTYWSVIGTSQDVPADTSTEEATASE